MNFDDALFDDALFEDPFLDVIVTAYDIYKRKGGSSLNIDEFTIFHNKKISPQHLAVKEKEFKKKTHLPKEKIKVKLKEYFFK